MDSGRHRKLSPDRILGAELRCSVSNCAGHHVLRPFSVQRIQDGSSLLQPRPSFFRSDSRGILAAVSEEKTPPGRWILYRKPELRPSFSMWEALRQQEIPTSLDSSAGGSLRQSASRSVPALPKRKGMREKGLGSGGDGRGEEEEDGEDEGNFTPHEIAARSPMTAFSVLEGAGRTLKGRDLRRVRNAVWRKTGFLD
ncbi:uncharacterized protein LOC116267079 [Nymphaea colorata]|uniref:Uncharacterized protein n=1 Tax=Nymphaea colorata TaxID=210225 RepID=A0A5K0VAF3_9MAGN|nr:uncharacterized protein LOC116267079 [Nymphaea colorata]